MIFPRLVGQPFGYVNMEAEALRWKEKNQPNPKTDNPLLNPTVCEQMVSECHTRLGLVFSYGGWLEDRENLWKGSYLDQEKTYLHTGLDLNAPTGTEIAAPSDADIIRIDDDKDMRGGWGPRVIMKPKKNQDQSVILLFAHLSQNIRCRIGDILKKGQIFADIGTPPENGNWYPHLHVQAVDLKLYQKLLKNDLHDLDGYGRFSEIATLAKQFRDPLNFINLK